LGAAWGSGAERRASSAIALALIASATATAPAPAAPIIRRWGAVHGAHPRQAAHA
jgi:hypothetical protein